jgi:hypothetical protein
MNRRKGLTRLALAVGIPYFGWWGLTYWGASSSQPRYLQWSHEAAEKGDWSMATIWMQRVNETSADINRSLLWGVVVPILALIVGALAFWVYRGFKPRT